MAGIQNPDLTSGERWSVLHDQTAGRKSQFSVKSATVLQAGLHKWLEYCLYSWKMRAHIVILGSYI